MKKYVADLLFRLWKRWSSDNKESLDGVQESNLRGEIVASRARSTLEDLVGLNARLRTCEGLDINELHQVEITVDMFFELLPQLVFEWPDEEITEVILAAAEKYLPNAIIPYLELPSGDREKVREDLFSGIRSLQVEIQHVESIAREKRLSEARMYARILAARFNLSEITNTLAELRE